jgi:hypothetical protein
MRYVRLIIASIEGGRGTSGDARKMRACEARCGELGAAELPYMGGDGEAHASIGQVLDGMGMLASRHNSEKRGTRGMSALFFDTTGGICGECRENEEWKRT